MGLLSGLMGNAGVVDQESLQAEYQQLLMTDEVIETGYKVLRDMFIFTNKRLILVDKQGITGKKTEYLTVPYGKITKFSVETAGSFDLDAELKIWIGSDTSPLQKKFTKAVDIYELQRVLSEHTL